MRKLRYWKVAVIIFLATMAVGAVAIVCGWMRWKGELSADGVATLAGGLLAFVAVMMQTDGEKNAREEETQRQRRAVATALLFEIDGFYRSHLRDVRNILASWSPKERKLLGMSSVGENPFPVYYANAAAVGELPTELVEAVVHFYGVAGSILSYFHDYALSEARARQLLAAVADLRDFQTQSEHHSERSVALQQLARIKDALPETIKLAFMVCYMLCEFVSVPFESPRIGVAAESLSMQQITASLTQAAPDDRMKEPNHPDSFNGQKD